MKPSYSFRGGWGGRRKEGGWAGGCRLWDAHLLGGSRAPPVNQVRRRQPRAGEAEEVAPPGKSRRGGESGWGGKGREGGKCALCVTLIWCWAGRAGRRASLWLLSSPPSHPVNGQRHLLVSLPPFFLPGLGASCPERALFAHRPYRTILGKGEKRSPHWRRSESEARLLQRLCLAVGDTDEPFQG